ncbi:hypothetical protein L484_008577 [Morus notabilis]|uniref:Uncharacterized protein n=1 Tax=Morus notabilis TaxID=981085 RepID=W9QJI8_9ROSA|nr:hypothetical protein L484_008577 [Morus notabilis]
MNTNYSRVLLLFTLSLVFATSMISTTNSRKLLWFNFVPPLQPGIPGFYPGITPGYPQYPIGSGVIPGIIPARDSVVGPEQAASP